MPGISAHFRNLAEQHPTRLLLALVALLFVPVLLAAEWYADGWAQRATAALAQDSASHLEERLRAEEDELELIFASLRRLPELLALDERVIDAVKADAHARNIPNNRHAALNAFLKTFASTLDLQLAWVLNPAGTCVAASNSESPASLVGSNYADRGYFDTAMTGGRGSQFAVGRMTGVPGFYFASPVRIGGEMAGVAAVKIDLPTLSQRLHLDSGFVTDDRGVIVLAPDKERIFHTLPGAPVRDMTVSARILRYKRDTFPELSLSPFTPPNLPPGQALYLVGGSTRPVLLGATHRPQDGLTLHVAEDIGEILTIEDQRTVRFLLAALSGLAALGGVLATSVNTLHARAQRRIIENSNQVLVRLNEELRQMAEHDHLTGCFNRRRLDEAMNTELARSARSGHPLSLAMLDLDHFKAVNDRHGHAVGDAMLAHVTDTIRRQLREPDVFARIGGEEFALLLPDTGEYNAAVLLDRIRRKVEETPLEHGETTIPITVSAGIAAARPELEPTAWMREADAALYAAKHCGRNRIIRASEMPEGFSANGLTPGACPPPIAEG